MFDVTNIIVGAIVGADIYVASAITAGLLGPASLLAWLAAGVLATLLALTLAECARQEQTAELIRARTVTSTTPHKEAAREGGLLTAPRAAEAARVSLG